eukprot:SAG31_NODE_623_length_13492_cov_62.118196_2_plen_226_part_00
MGVLQGCETHAQSGCMYESGTNPVRYHARKLIRFKKCYKLACSHACRKITSPNGNLPCPAAIIVQIWLSLKKSVDRMIPHRVDSSTKSATAPSALTVAQCDRGSCVSCVLLNRYLLTGGDPISKCSCDECFITTTDADNRVTEDGARGAGALKHYCNLNRCDSTGAAWTVTGGQVQPAASVRYANPPESFLCLKIHPRKIDVTIIGGQCYVEATIFLGSALINKP